MNKLINGGTMSQVRECTINSRGLDMYKIQPELASAKRYIVALDEGYTIHAVTSRMYELVHSVKGAVAIFTGTTIGICSGKYVMANGQSVTERSYIISKRTLDILTRTHVLDNQESILEIPGPGRLTKQPSYLHYKDRTESVGVLAITNSDDVDKYKAYTKLPSGELLIPTRGNYETE